MNRKNTPDNTLFTTPSAESNPKGREHSKLRSSLSALMAVAALSACSAENVTAESTPTPTVQLETPGTGESVAPTLSEARETLSNFSPKPSPTLYEFLSSNKKDVEAARDYLSIKHHSKVAVVDYTNLPDNSLRDFGDVVEDRIESVTQTTFDTEVDVFHASTLAQQLYSESNPDGRFDPTVPSHYGAAVAEVAMPGLDRYDSIIALTDSRLSKESHTTGEAITMPSGRYVDLLSFTRLYQPILSKKDTDPEAFLYDPRDVAVHEWLHATARIEHAKTIYDDSGHIGDAFLSSSHVNLESFIQSATVNEFGDYNIMGITTSMGETPELSTAQIYTTEAAERALRKPVTVQATDLRDTTRVEYTTSSSNTAISLVRLDSILTVNGPDDKSLNVFDRLTITPIHNDNVWSIEIHGLTLDNGTIRFGSIYPEQGKPYTLELPGEVSVGITLTNNDTLEIIAN